jgi:hypothetical protein
LASTIRRGTMSLVAYGARAELCFCRAFTLSLIEDAGGACTMTGEDVLNARLEWHRDSANLKAPSHWVGAAICPVSVGILPMKTHSISR